MMKRILILFSFILLTLTALNGCGKANSQNGETEQKFTVYTTVYPLQFFAETIGGDYVHVESIYPPGVDEHSFEPSQKDLIEMAKADLFLYIGYGLEGFAEKANPILEKEGVSSVAVGEMIQLENETHEDEDGEGSHEEEDHEAEGEHTEEDGNHSEEDGDHSEESHHHLVDPHLWIDPIYSQQMAEVIFDQLSKAMPDKKDIFSENLNELKNRLEQLHNQLTETSHKAKTKDFIVSHAAYGYWEKRYGLHQLNIAGISSSQEPSQKQLKEIIDRVEEHHLRYILVEQNISNKLVEVVQKEAGVEALPIHNLSVLTEKDIEEREDYFSIMESNINTLKKALGAE